jgi:5-hydroxyisourate hydrolase
MPGVTTHVLDTSRGSPASGILVRLEQRVGTDDWRPVGSGHTNTDGRVSDLVPAGTALTPGQYRLTFETQPYFASQSVQAFYPNVVVTFEAAAGEAHYHVPLLLSPFGYSTYRGS